MRDYFKSINWRIWMIKLIVILFTCAVCFGGCSYFNRKLGLEDDNPIEEAIEDIIENRTGIEIDLTP